MTIYKKIFRALNKGRVKYVVVGGVAVNLHGYLRMTADLDIVMALDKDNLAKMDAVMKYLGYFPRIPVEIHELSDRKKLKQWMEEKGMQAYTFVPSGASPLQIDIVIAESLKFSDVVRKKIIKKMQNVSIPVISIDDLVKMKRKANRAQDLQDLEVLLKIKGL